MKSILTLQGELALESVVNTLRRAILSHAGVRLHALLLFVNTSSPQRGEE